MKLTIKLVFALLLTLQIDFVFAQSEYQETVTFGGNSYLTEEQSYKSESEQFAITWPVLAGESIKDIAALFYPKNKIMQQKFI